jgi:hypothetical protein
MWQVQELDLEVARLRRALEELDSGEELRAHVQALKAEVASLGAGREKTQAEQLDRDLEMKTLEEKKKKSETHLYSGRVSNPKQLASFQQEVEMLAREIDRLSDLILQLLEELDTGRKTLAEKEKLLAEEGAQLEATEETYAATSTRLRGEIEAREARRAKAAGEVPAALLRRYEQIRTRQGGVGMVKVTEPVCPGCHVGIPSEVMKAIKAYSQPQGCESCGRLFYYEKKAAE